MADSLPDDAVRELLVRMKDVPAALFRCATVCKRWLGLVADPSFLRRCWPENSGQYSPFSFAGFIVTNDEKGIKRFVPAPRSALGPVRRALSSLVPTVPAGEVVPLVSRRGLLLVRLGSNTTPVQLAVCDLHAGTCHMLPPLNPKFTICEYQVCGYAVLTAADCRSDGDDKQLQLPQSDPSSFFKVVIFSYHEHDNKYHLHTISSEQGKHNVDQWGNDSSFGYTLLGRMRLSSLLPLQLTNRLIRPSSELSLQREFEPGWTGRALAILATKLALISPSEQGSWSMRNDCFQRTAPGTAGFFSDVVVCHGMAYWLFDNWEEDFYMASLNIQTGHLSFTKLIHFPRHYSRSCPCLILATADNTLSVLRVQGSGMDTILEVWGQKDQQNMDGTSEWICTRTIELKQPDVTRKTMLYLMGEKCGTLLLTDNLAAAVYTADLETGTVERVADWPNGCRVVPGEAVPLELDWMAIFVSRLCSKYR